MVSAACQGREGHCSRTTAVTGGSGSTRASRQPNLLDIPEASLGRGHGRGMSLVWRTDSSDTAERITPSCSSDPMSIIIIAPPRNVAEVMEWRKVGLCVYVWDVEIRSSERKKEIYSVNHPTGCGSALFLPLLRAVVAAALEPVAGIGSQCQCQHCHLPSSGGRCVCDTSFAGAASTGETCRLVRASCAQSLSRVARRMRVSAKICSHVCPSACQSSNSQVQNSTVQDKTNTM